MSGYCQAAVMLEDGMGLYVCEGLTAKGMCTNKAKFRVWQQSHGGSVTSTAWSVCAVHLHQIISRCLPEHIPDTSVIVRRLVP